MPKAIDIRGQRFGRLVAIKPTNERQTNEVIWLCECDCGNRAKVRSCNLTDGQTESCGCIARERGRMVIKSVNYHKRKHDYKGTNIKDLTNKIRSDNSSGTKGVSYVGSRNRWVAYISLQGKRKTLGYYIDKKDAIKARKQAEEELFHPIIEEYKNLSKE